MLPLTEYLETAVQAAHAGAAVLKNYRSSPSSLVIDFKGRNDLVSQADRESEQAVIEILRAGAPELAIIAEESGGQSAGAATWHIDPLDGTTNYLHGIGHFAVSIGLVAHAGTQDPTGQVLQADTPVLGVIYDPIREEIFTGLRGVGAWCNGHRIQHSRVKLLENALIAAGIPVRELDQIDDYMNVIKDVVMCTRGIRRQGAAALDLAWVACGRVDGYFEEKLSTWDIAAGVVIAQEAGAQVSDPLEPDAAWPASGRLVAAGPRIHDALVAIYRSHMKPQA